MDNRKLCSIRNRNNGVTTYQLPDMHIERRFGAGETKKVPYEELLALSFAPGGKFMLEELLVIEEPEVLKALQMEVEPEYFYTSAMIRDLLFTASYDEFADFLDFAPEGAIEIAKELAVKEQLPDTRKREMIEKKTGFSVNNAIMINRVMDEEETKAEEPATKQRRVQPAENTAQPTRRVEPPQYKVVEKKTVK